MRHRTMDLAGSTMPTYRGGFCEQSECFAFAIGPREDGLLTCKGHGGTDIFVRYAELLRRAWLNPSCASWQHDVCAFEHEYGEVLERHFRRWREKAELGQK